LRIYRTRQVDGYEWCLPVRDEYFRLIATAAPEELAALGPIEMRSVRDKPGGPPDARAILPWLGSHVLIGRPEAAELLALIEDFGTVVPAVCEGEPLWLFRAERQVDALDLDESVVEWLEPGERVLQIRKYVFRPEVVAAAPPVFKLPRYRRGPAYYRQEVVDRVLATELTGTSFQCVWPDH
jgi:hypothetical protein